MNTVTGAHLIGSVPLPDAETVLRGVARELGPHLAPIRRVCRDCWPRIGM